MEGTKPGVTIVVAIIGLAGAVWAANITAGRKFDEKFEKLEQSTARLEESSRTLDSEFRTANSRLASLNGESEALKRQLASLSGFSASNIAKVVQAGSLPPLGWGDSAWTLDKATGRDMPSFPNAREFRRRVDFPHDFAATPNVVVALRYIDALPGGGLSNVRISADADNRTARGFDLVLRTWDKSKVFGVSVVWVAVGG